MSTNRLSEKINSKTFKMGIIGMGYVGLPLALEFAQKNIQVVGYDINEHKVSQLNQGISYIQDISSDTLQSISSNVFSATSDFTSLADVDVISICVPTPLRKTKDPDMSYIVNSIQTITQYLRPGQLIILESTTYPGTTEEAVLPQLEETGLMVGKDFYLAFSPERVDPGNVHFNTANTPKIIGGVTEKCTQLANDVYSIVINQVIPVSSPRSAEMVKLYENTFRAVNIAMANEMALMCDKLDISVWEVIESAATKPFGFMPFYPGPGLGGHCIPIDPHYLSWKLKSLNYEPKFISLAESINGAMPNYVVSKVTSSLNTHKKSVNGSQILILGVAYKANINDIRESPALSIISSLQELGANIQYHDSFIPSFKIDGKTLHSCEINPEQLKACDCVVIITHHNDVSIPMVIEHSALIVDSRNATKGNQSNNIVRI